MTITGELCSLAKSHLKRSMRPASVATMQRRRLMAHNQRADTDASSSIYHNSSRWPVYRQASGSREKDIISQTVLFYDSIHLQQSRDYKYDMTI